MKECNIIRDLLPLYAEKLSSGDTNEYVETHLRSCSACRAELDRLCAPEPASPQEALPLKNLQKKLRAKRTCTILMTTLFVLAVAGAAFSALCAPRYLPYNDSLLKVEREGNDVLLVFDQSVTHIERVQEQDPEEGGAVYSISAATSLLSTPQKKEGQITCRVSSAENPVIYYVQNNGQPDVCIYGTPHGGRLTLPRLALGYYLFGAGAVWIALAVAWVIVRKKEKARIRTERLLLAPIAYFAGHLCVMGLSTVAYAFTFKFSMILLLALLFYAAFLLAHHIFRLKNEGI